VTSNFTSVPFFPTYLSCVTFEDPQSSRYGTPLHAAGRSWAQFLGCRPALQWKQPPPIVEHLCQPCCVHNTELLLQISILVWQQWSCRQHTASAMGFNHQ
jgi:hypothetical protein